MLQEGRLPMSVIEQKMVEDLITSYPNKDISITRRDPGNTGPLLVHVNDETYEVAE